MKGTKFCKQRCYFLTFFCPDDDSVAHLLILLCAKILGYLCEAFEIREKGNNEGRERGCRQDLYRGTKNF